MQQNNLTSSTQQIILQSEKSKAKPKGKLGADQYEGEDKTRDAATRPAHDHTTESDIDRIDLSAETQRVAVVQHIDSERASVLHPLDTNGVLEKHSPDARDNTLKNFLPTPELEKSFTGHHFTAKQKTGITKEFVISSRDSVEALRSTPSKIDSYSRRKRKVVLTSSDEEEEESTRIRAGKKSRLV